MIHYSLTEPKRFETFEPIEAFETIETFETFKSSETMFESRGGERVVDTLSKP